MRIFKLDETNEFFSDAKNLKSESRSAKFKPYAMPFVSDKMNDFGKKR